MFANAESGVDLAIALSGMKFKVSIHFWNANLHNRTCFVLKMQ